MGKNLPGNNFVNPELSPSHSRSPLISHLYTHPPAALISRRPPPSVAGSSLSTVSPPAASHHVHRLPPTSRRRSCSKHGSGPQRQTHCRPSPQSYRHELNWNNSEQEHPIKP